MTKQCHVCCYRWCVTAKSLVRSQNMSVAMATLGTSCCLRMKCDRRSVISLCFCFLHHFCEFECCMLVCSFFGPCVRESFTKCTIMFCEQMVGPRSANLCMHMRADKVRSPANFHEYRCRPWPSFSRLKIRMEYIGKSIMHSSLDAYRHGFSGYGVSGRCQYYCYNVNYMSGFEVDYLSPRIWQGVLAYSLILKRNATHCILAYCIRRSVCMCVCSSVLTLSWVDCTKMI